jgi:glycosyltransferase involved in cell wall biosynthesis
VGEVRRIIREKKVDIVTAHSYWTMMLSRMATPKDVALVNTYHFADYDTLRHTPNCRRMMALDKLTYRKRIRVVAVSGYVQNVLKEQCNYGEAIAIPNFVSEKFSLNPSSEAASWKPGKHLKLVATGSLKKEKNYELLLEAFKDLKDSPVSLDVYGGGPLLETFRQQAIQSGITNLVFKGPSSQLPELLPQYDAYVMSSFSEACPLSPIEALSCGLPLILSDIPPLLEITDGKGLFFTNRDSSSFVQLIGDVISGARPLFYNPEFAKERLDYYSKARCLADLDTLYRDLLRP